MLCEEQVRLSAALIEATALVFSAKNTLERALKEKWEVAAAAAALTEARRAEALAISAVALHKKEHGCLSSAASGAG